MRRDNDPPEADPETVARLAKLQPLQPIFPYGHTAKPLNAVGQERVEEHRWIAYQLAWKFARRHARDVPVDELISEAFFGLTYAAGLFDETRRVPFGAYANMVIRHRLIQGIRVWRRARRAGPFPTSTIWGETEWEAQDPTIPVDRAETQEMCKRVREVMPARWYDALRMYHAEGRTLDEIGREMGITRQRVRQLVVKASVRARRHFPDWSRF